MAKRRCRSSCLRPGSFATIVATDSSLLSRSAERVVGVAQGVEHVRVQAGLDRGQGPASLAGLGPGDLHCTPANPFLPPPPVARPPPPRLPAPPSAGGGPPPRGGH